MVSVTKLPNTVSQSGDGITWTGLDNIKNDVTGYAVADPPGSVSCLSTKTLQASNFQFNLPSNSVVTGVRIEVRYANKMRPVSICSKKHFVRAVLNNGQTYSSGRVAYVPNGTRSTFTVGGDGNLLGLSSKPSDYNDGLTIRYAADVERLQEVQVNYIRVTVYYRLPTYTLAALMTPTSQVNGRLVTYKLTLTNTNNTHQGQIIPVTLTLPAGLTYVSHTSNGTYNSGSKKWNALLTGNKTATLTLTLRTTTTGTKQIRAQVDSYTTTITTNLNVTPPTPTIASVNIPRTVMEDDNLVVTVTMGLNSPLNLNTVVSVPVPEGFSFVSSSGNGSYSSGTGKWTAQFPNITGTSPNATTQTVTRTFTFKANTPGQYAYTITVDSTGATSSYNVIVISKYVTTPFYATLNISEVLEDEGGSLQVDQLCDGERYTISCYINITDTASSPIYPGVLNYRLGVTNGASEVLSNRPTAINTWQRIGATFTYKEEDDILVRVYGQYVEVMPENITVQFAGFSIEHGTNTTYKAPTGLFNKPPLLLADEEYTQVTLAPDKESNLAILEGVNLSGRESDPHLIQKGFGVLVDYVATEELECHVTLSINGEEQYKTLILKPDTNTILFGGLADYWGFYKPYLNDIKISVTVKNWTTETITAAFQNIQFVLYSQHDETGGNPGFTINGVHSREYNLFCDSDFDKPEGLSKEIELLDLKQRDGELITAISNKAKKLKISFSVLGCSLTEMNQRLQEAIRWMSNEKDGNGITQPNHLVFDWDPDRVYEVFIEDAVPVKYGDGVMECDVEFIVPRGMAMSPLRSMGASGYNAGLTTTYPVVQVKSLGESGIKLVDSVSGHELYLNHRIPSDESVYFDSQRRKIYTRIEDADKNNPTITNLAEANVATATSKNKNTTGFTVYRNAILSSSTEWKHDNLTRSLKVQTPGNQDREGVLTHHVGGLSTGQTIRAHLIIKSAHNLLIGIEEWDDSQWLRANNPVFQFSEEGEVRKISLSTMLGENTTRIKVWVRQNGTTAGTFYIGMVIITNNQPIPMTNIMNPNSGALKSYFDLTPLLSLNSTFPSIREKEYFDFSKSSGCIIQKVEFQEGI